MRIYNEDKSTFQKNGFGKTRHAKESNWFTLTPCKNNNNNNNKFKMYTDLNVKPETIKLVEENIGSMLCEISLISIF